MRTNSTQQYGALILRVTLGVILVAHSLLKAVVFTMPGTVEFFQSLGLPSALAYVTVAMELVAGALLIAGYRTRGVALAVLPILLGATWAHLPNGWVFNAPNGGWEYPLFLSVAVIVQALLGDGAFALGSVRSESHPRHARA